MSVKKFGLVKMQGLAAPPKKAIAPKKMAANVFGGDDENDDEQEMKNIRKGIDVGSVNRSVLLLQQKSSRVTEKLKQDALAEDSSIYSYDEVYDEMQEDKGEKQDNRKKDFDPSHGSVRYVANDFFERIIYLFTNLSSQKGEPIYRAAEKIS